MTQWNKVLLYLREHGVATSNELRGLHIVDVPKVISILRRKGYPITPKGNPDGTSTYYYDKQPRADQEWEFTADGRAILK